MVIYVAAKIGILPGMEIEGMSKCDFILALRTGMSYTRSWPREGQLLLSPHK
jgi:hypothetical protein